MKYFENPHEFQAYGRIHHQDIHHRTDIRVYIWREEKIPAVTKEIESYFIRFALFRLRTVPKESQQFFLQAGLCDGEKYKVQGTLYDDRSAKTLLRLKVPRSCVEYDKGLREWGISLRHFTVYVNREFFVCDGDTDSR